MISIWWSGLSLAMKILWGVTLAASLIFVIQSVMTFIGLGGDVDIDGTGFDTDLNSADGAFDADPSMSLYTFRNLVNFLLGFGWTAIIMSPKIHSVSLLLFISLLVGVALVALVMLLFKWLWGMQESGNINVFESAAGCQGKVYLTIPAERSGEGKVQITINNAVREYNAVTDGDEIKTGTDIKVLEALNSNTMVVEPINSLII